MSRYFGIGGGSDASNFLTGWRKEDAYRDEQGAKARQVERENESLRGTKMRNDHELTAEDRRDDNHGLGITAKELANESTAARLDENRSQYAQNDLNRAAEASTLGIRTDAVASNAQSQIDANDSESRMRPIRERTEKSDLATKRNENRLRQLVNASTERQLDAREQNEFNQLAMKEQEDVFKTSKVSPEEAARMINDSAIMDVDDGATVKIEDGKWRLYNDQGEISVNKKTGKPVEWNINELEKLFTKPQKGSKASGTAKAKSYDRKGMAKAVSEQMLSAYGYEDTQSMSSDERFAFNKDVADAERLAKADPDVTISEAVASSKQYRELREKYNIPISELKANAEKNGVSILEELENAISQIQQIESGPPIKE